MFRVLIFLIAFTCVYGKVQKAVVVLNSDKISGRISFTQNDDGSVKVDGTITGLPAGKHGFHIHEKGDLDNSCVAAGGHFNPTKKDHGAPSAENRHVGDLGNIEANDTIAVVSINDKLIALDGDNSIIGRALVIHEGEDDLGKGGFNDSKTTGHAGARLACGVVGIATISTNGIELFANAGYFIFIGSLYTLLKTYIIV